MTEHSDSPPRHLTERALVFLFRSRYDHRGVVTTAIVDDFGAFTLTMDLHTGKFHFDGDAEREASEHRAGEE